MCVNQKEIYASIEFVEQEIRFVLGEFHNSRLNILNIEIFPTTAIMNDQILNEQQLVSDIKSLIEIVDKKMKVSLKRVLVILPSNSLNRYSKRLTIGLYDKELSEKLVEDTIFTLADRELASDEILVNHKISKYFIDGVAKNKIDYDKTVKSLALDVDLYAGSKQMVFDYLNIVEKSGLEILDMTFDSMAMASEMASFEASHVKNIIIVRYEFNKIELSLISEGRILSSVALPMGYSEIIEKILETHNLSVSSANKLVLLNDYLLSNDKEVMPVFLYTNNEQQTVAIDDKYLRDLAIPILFKQFEEVYQIIDPIMMAKETDIYLTGKGASIVSIQEVLSNILKAKVKKYIPEVIGARTATLVANLGALYLYRDESIHKGIREISVDEDIKPMANASRHYNESEDSMTNRFKELFKIN